MNLTNWIVIGTIAAIADSGMPANAAPLLSNAVAIGAVSAIATSTFRPPFTIDRTIDQSDISGTYVSGVTSTTVVDGFASLTDSFAWFSASGASVGNIVFDLGSIYTLDRVYLFWANSGNVNNMADITFDVSSDSNFALFSSPAAFDGNPTAGVNRIDFTSLGIGRFVRLNWNSRQGDYAGLNEFVAGGVANVGGGVPEPANWAMLIAGFGLTGVFMRRRRGSPGLAA